MDILLSIVGFIGVGLMLIAAVIITVSLSDLPDDMSGLGSFGFMKKFSIIILFF